MKRGRLIKGASSGFTIVELLIVVVVIAILAAITIVSYSGISIRSKEAALKSDVETADKKIVEYSTTEGSYPSNLDQTGFTTTSGDVYYSSSRSYYCVSISRDTLAYFTSIDNTSPTEGGCAPTGDEVAKLVASDVVTDDNFGYSVSLYGDTAIVGSRYDDDNGSSSGSAYIFN